MGDDPVAPRRRLLLAAVPRVLLALAGACAASALIGMVAALFGRAEPPLLWMLVPPVFVVLGTPLLVSRSARDER